MNIVETLERFRMRDGIGRADGTYVEFGRDLCDDFDFEPRDREEWRKIKGGENVVYGVRAMASIQVVERGTATCYTIKSAGCWGVVVTSSTDAYLDDVYKEELTTLKAHLATFGAMVEL